MSKEALAAREPFEMLESFDGKAALGLECDWTPLLE